MVPPAAGRLAARARPVLEACSVAALAPPPRPQHMCNALYSHTLTGEASLSNDPEVQAHVAFAGRLAAWVKRAGVTDDAAIGDIAVGFADIIDGAARAKRELEAMLALDPRDPTDALQAIAHLGYLQALFIGEIKAHAEDLEARWPMLEECVAAFLPPDENPDTGIDA